MHLYQVKLGRVTAALVVGADGQILTCAPVLKSFRGQHITNLRRWVRVKQGEMAYLGPVGEE